jgi:hypothetical protein
MGTTFYNDGFSIDVFDYQRVNGAGKSGKSW